GRDRGGAGRRAPGPGGLEVTGTPLEASALDTQRRIGPFGLALDPRHPHVGVGRRRPAGLGRRPRRAVEPRFGKERRPVGRTGPRRRVGGRNRLETDEAPERIEPHADHPRGHRRRGGLAPAPPARPSAPPPPRGGPRPPPPPT